MVAAAKGLPIPAPDEMPVEDLGQPSTKGDSHSILSDQNLNSLTVPISSRSQSYNSDSSSNISPQPTFSLPASSLPGSALLRGRAKTLASLTTSSKNSPQPEMMPREMHLPRDPCVNGQPIEAYLYKDAAECPICFLYYPPLLNKTRCCDQPICSECFVQIKRPDPHPPEHADSPAVPPETSSTGESDPEAALVSEPAACPFCVQPEFGITYDPPSFRRGLTHVNHMVTHPVANVGSAMSSNSSLASFSGNGGHASQMTTSRRRTTSLSVNAPAVITTDRVRPDWASKLSSARAHAARRSAAATALHTAAYLMGNRNHSPDARGFGGFGRRGMLRRGTGNESPSGGINSAHLNMLVLMSERYAASTGTRVASSNSGESSPAMIGPPRESSRRNRMEDLEEMMMMEAIRLSLASEEERRKREEKDAKKEAKKKVKDEKKAEKLARKTAGLQSSTNDNSRPSDKPLNFMNSDEVGKGKGIDNGRTADTNMPNVDLSIGSGSHRLAESPVGGNPQIYLERSRAQFQQETFPTSQIYGPSSYKPSHLRTLSNASSSASSIVDLIPGAYEASGSHSSVDVSPNGSGVNIARGDPSGGGTGVESMFNFQSLAAMIGEDEKSCMHGHLEHPNETEHSEAAEHATNKAKHSHPEGDSRNISAINQTAESVADLSQSFATLRGHDASNAVSVDATHSEMPQSGPQTGSDLKYRDIDVMNIEDTRRETGSV